MIIQDIIEAIEAVCPRAYQEDYDNSGVQVGDTNREATGALLCVDVTEAVLEEAIRLGCNLVIAHHPILFKPLKRLTGSSYVERCVELAVRHGLVLYAAHTNADNAPQGLNALLAERFGLLNTRPLEPLQGKHLELVTFVHGACRCREAGFVAGRCRPLGALRLLFVQPCRHRDFQSCRGCQSLCGSDRRIAP